MENQQVHIEQKLVQEIERINSSNIGEVINLEFTKERFNFAKLKISNQYEAKINHGKTDSNGIYISISWKNNGKFFYSSTTYYDHDMNYLSKNANLDYLMQYSE